MKYAEYPKSPPSDICSDLREGAGEQLSSPALRSARTCGAFLGAGDDLGATPSEERLRASSESVRPVELESGLLTHAAPLRGPSGSGLSPTWAEEAALDEAYRSEEWEDRDSMLPMGVLLGLLLNVSPKQGPEQRQTGPSLKPAAWRSRTCTPTSAPMLTFCIGQAQCRGVEAPRLPGARGQTDGPAPARFRSALRLGQGHVGVRSLVEDLGVRAETAVNSSNVVSRTFCLLTLSKFSISISTTMFWNLMFIMAATVSSCDRIRVGPKMTPRLDTVIRLNWLCVETLRVKE